MLSKNNLYQIQAFTDSQYAKIKGLMTGIATDIVVEFKKDASRIILSQKEPYLNEVLETYQKNTTLEKKYSASDILIVLETIFDELKLGEFGE